MTVLSSEPIKIRAISPTHRNDQQELVQKCQELMNESLSTSVKVEQLEKNLFSPPKISSVPQNPSKLPAGWLSQK